MRQPACVVVAIAACALTIAGCGSGSPSAGHSMPDLVAALQRIYPVDNSGAYQVSWSCASTTSCQATLVVVGLVYDFDIRWDGTGRCFQASLTNGIPSLNSGISDFSGCVGSQTNTTSTGSANLGSSTATSSAPPPTTSTSASPPSSSVDCGPYNVPGGNPSHYTDITVTGTSCAVGHVMAKTDALGTSAPRSTIGEGWACGGPPPNSDPQLEAQCTNTNGPGEVDLYTNSNGY